MQLIDISINKVNVEVLLQPTSPFRKRKTFLKNKHSVVTFYKNIFSTKKIYTINKNMLIKINKRNEANYKRNLFVKINGSLFFNTAAKLKKFKNITNVKSVPFL
jgi:hypothetical protein